MRGETLFLAICFFFFEVFLHDDGIGQLSVGVADFHTADVEFEALGKVGGVAVFVEDGLGQGGKASGVVENKDGFVLGKVGFDFVDHSLGEKGFPLGIVSRSVF